MEPEVRAFFIRVLMSLTAAVLWMVVNVWGWDIPWVVVLRRYVQDRQHHLLFLYGYKFRGDDLVSGEVVEWEDERPG